MMKPPVPACGNPLACTRRLAGCLRCLPVVDGCLPKEAAP